eukprot:1894475-Prymnesium_polylepis.1
MFFWKASFISRSVARRGPTTAAAPVEIEIALATIEIDDCTSIASMSSGLLSICALAIAGSARSSSVTASAFERPPVPPASHAHALAPSRS